MIGDVTISSNVFPDITFNPVKGGGTASGILKVIQPQVTVDLAGTQQIYAPQGTPSMKWVFFVGVAVMGVGLFSIINYARKKL